MKGERDGEYTTAKSSCKNQSGAGCTWKKREWYHDVRMVMQTIYLYDNITIQRTETPGITLESNLYFLPNDEGNIAYKAAKMLMDEFEIRDGVHITLDKHIPVAAGLAGGSSNAAAVLVGMNRMFSLGLSEMDLMERGVKLGADVPYCIMRGTVLAEGIGEELTRLSPLPKCYILIAKPGISVSTRTVYEKLDALTITEHPDIDGLITGLENQDLRAVASSMGNVLEQVTVDAYPVIDRIKNVMKEQGALNAMMSGSGPTVFGIFEDRQTAKKAQRKIKELQIAKQVYLANVHNTKRR